MNQQELKVFINAVEVGDVDRVQKLLRACSTRGLTLAANGYNVNDALCDAAWFGRIETIQLLLQLPLTCGFTQGADVHANNERALRFAANNGQTKTVQFFLQAGADVHADDDEALREAAENGHVETVQVLLQAGANVHAVNSRLLDKTIWRSPKVTQMLLQAGANSEGLSFKDLKKLLSPKFILTLSNEIISGLETSHPGLKRYKWPEKMNNFKAKQNKIKDEDILSAKNSLADFYYRPCNLGYLRAISDD